MTVRRQRGQGVAGKNICGGRTVRAKALTHLLHYGAFIVRHAMPHLTRNTAERRAYCGHPLRRDKNGEAMSVNKGSTLESQGTNFQQTANMPSAKTTALDRTKNYHTTII